MGCESSPLFFMMVLETHPLSERVGGCIRGNADDADFYDFHGCFWMYDVGGWRLEVGERHPDDMMPAADRRRI